MVGATTQELDKIWEEAEERRLERDRRRRKPPMIRLWDGDWTLRGEVSGALEWDFRWVRNNTGEGTLVLPADHHLARWAVADWDRSTENVHVTVDKDGMRWGGMMSDVTYKFDPDAGDTVTLQFLDDIEHLKKILVWANPFTPAAVQWPKNFALAGPSRYMCKLALFLNLWRMQGNWWALPDDPLNWKEWTRPVNWTQWPILVKPDSLLLDDSKWTIIQSRFRTWHDMVSGPLEDAGLTITTRRWLVGDPQPWPGAMLHRSGHLIVDIKDTSGWFSQTAVGGTIAGGLLRTGLEVADDGIEQVRRALGKVTLPGEYYRPGFLGTKPEQPWVVYRTQIEGPTSSTVQSAEYHMSPATSTQMVAGGQSMPGVNEGITATIQTIGALLASFLFIPNLAGPAVTLLEPLYRDVFLAFASYKSILRSRRLGWSHYEEHWVDGGRTSYTLSQVMAMRQGMLDTGTKRSHTIQVGDAAPYLVGEQGEGHFTIGDRVATEVPGSGGRLVVDMVSQLALSGSAEKPPEWTITIGELPDGDPVDAVLDKTHAIGTVLKDWGLGV